MAKWMNQIGTIIESRVPDIRKYTDRGAQHVVPQREWTALHANTPLPPGSLYQIKCKPDIVLVEKSGNDNLQWSDILGFSETTTILYNPRTEPSVKQKSYIMFMEQDNRSFNPVIYFKDDHFGFHLYDRNGLQKYFMKVKAVRAASNILHILAHLLFGRPASIGYDETIQCKGGRAERIMQRNEWWNVDRELYNSPSFVGQSTKCWVVSRGEGNDIPIRLVLKDTWASAPSAENEYKVLKRIKEENINGGRSLPRLHDWDYVPVPPIYDGIDAESTAHCDPDNVTARVHCRLLSGPVAYPLECFVNLKDLMGALADTVQGIFSSFTKIYC